MPTTEQNAAMQSKLAELKLPHESIAVFGAIRCNVHVKCKSRKTAHKWAAALAAVLDTAPNITKTVWEANSKGAWHKGFLIVAAA